MKSKPRVIDLFAGAGGLSLGFKWAGYEISACLEVDKWACDTLRANHGGSRVIQQDIRELTSPLAIRQVCDGDPDIIIGGPPCQGFSHAGPARKDPKDPRNSLFRDFARWVSVLSPEVFLFENVRGILRRKTETGQSVPEVICETFAALEYDVSVWLLDAAAFGVPQRRERVFFVGSRDGVLPPPKPTHAVSIHNGSQESLFGEPELRLTPTLWDAISDLPELAAGEGKEEQCYTGEAETQYQEWARIGSSMLYNHVAMNHSERVVERFRHISSGKSGSDVPIEHRARRRNSKEINHQGYDQNNRRLRPNKPSSTIAASFYANFVHPYQHRNLTAREGARVQSFPDSYRFQGKKTVVSQKLLAREGRSSEQHLCQYNQIGNAVPPLLAMKIAEHIRRSF